tara:strand:- start:11 stop:199 length:189 start_codon:yes stop_codon:yes gene_type:complete
MERTMKLDKININEFYENSKEDRDDILKSDIDMKLAQIITTDCEHDKKRLHRELAQLTQMSE